MILNPMLDHFRKMMKEVEDKNLSGDDFDQMKATLNRMEELGQQHSDIMTLNGAFMQENLFGKFSDHYGKVLASEAQQSSSDGGYDDSVLLKQSLDALRSAIAEIKRSYNEMLAEANKDQGNNSKQIDQSVEAAILNDPSQIIKGIEDVIHLGEEEGMTFPRFLRIQMEKGLDKAMEGTIVVKDGLQFLLGAAKASASSPYHIQIEQEKLDAYNTLASQSEFQLPNSKELSYAHREIDYKHAKDMAVWNEIVERWDTLLFELSFWSLSYTKVAPYIEPWSMANDPVASTIKTQKITPGIFKERLKLFKKYFGLDFLDVFKHPTFKWEVEHHHIGYSQEYVTFLIEKVYPECKPFNDLSQDIIDTRLAFREQNKEGDPESHLTTEKYRIFYDSYFGDGRFTEKFGTIQPSSSVASPWNLSSFQYSN